MQSMRESHHLQACKLLGQRESLHGQQLPVPSKVSVEWGYFARYLLASGRWHMEDWSQSFEESLIHWQKSHELF